MGRDCLVSDGAHGLSPGDGDIVGHRVGCCKNAQKQPIDVKKDTVMPHRSREVPRVQGDAPVERTMSLIDGKWKIIVLYKLLRGTLRFNEAAPAQSRRSPSACHLSVRELEADGLILRTVLMPRSRPGSSTLTAHGPEALSRCSWR